MNSNKESLTDVKKTWPIKVTIRVTHVNNASHVIFVRTEPTKARNSQT